MNRTKTSKPPLGFIECVSAVQELHLATQQATKAAQQWTLMGPGAAWLIRKELARIRAHVDACDQALKAIEDARAEAAKA